MVQLERRPISVEQSAKPGELNKKNGKEDEDPLQELSPSILVQFYKRTTSKTMIARWEVVVSKVVAFLFCCRTKKKKN